MRIGKRSWYVFVAVLVGCLGLVLVLSSRPETSLPLGLMERPFKMPAQRQSWFSRLVPTTPGWVWLWRLKDAVLGPRQLVNIDASTFALADWSDAALTNLALGQPDFADTNGLKLWVRGQAELNRLRAEMVRTPSNELLSSPRISTIDGMPACLFSGSMVVANGCTNQVGLTLEVCARVRSEATELTTIITVSEMITNGAAGGAEVSPTTGPTVRTNLEAAARLRLTEGTGLFLLDTGPAQPDRRHIGVILSAVVPKRR